MTAAEPINEDTATKHNQQTSWWCWRCTNLKSSAVEMFKLLHHTSIIF